MGNIFAINLAMKNGRKMGMKHMQNKNKEENKMTETETQPTQEIIKKESISISERAKIIALAIKDEDTYTEAMEFLKTIKGARKKAKDWFEPLKKKTKAAWDEVCGMFNEVDTPLENSEKVIKSYGEKYLDEQKRLKQIEADRIAAEERKRAEEAKLSEAENIANTGDHEAANAVLEKPLITAPAPKVTNTKVSGIRVSEVWSAEVTDLKALIKDVAEGKAPLCTLQANMSELNRLAKALKAEMKYAGVKVCLRSGIGAKG